MVFTVPAFGPCRLAFPAGASRDNDAAANMIFRDDDKLTTMANNPTYRRADRHETVGHEWDGIEELNNAAAALVAVDLLPHDHLGAGYVIIYPAWPLAKQRDQGDAGLDQPGQLAAEMQAGRCQARAAGRALAAIPSSNWSPTRSSDAGRGCGRQGAAFKVHCVQCHGSGAAGSKGYPNLNDDDWLWGGDISAIHYTLTHGIRNPDHAETRVSCHACLCRHADACRNFGVVGHVQSLSGKAKPNAKASCRTVRCQLRIVPRPDGKGCANSGAPNLTDGIWLYGGDKATLTQTVKQ
jgi:cytochrome c oxidase cbb3-type subunit 3